MTSREPDSPAYKDVTLRQLRSFCETARLGSMTSAARELNLAHPTVWKQVHALEDHFRVRLVESHPRGCRLTDEGRVLAELASPLVTDIDRLRREFGSERSRLGSKLGVASSSRILIEALPMVVADFTKSRPEIQLTLRQMEDPRVADAVESGEADLGMTASNLAPETRPLLACNLCCHVEVTLIAPPRHPVTRLRTLGPFDVGRWPLVNSRESFRDPAINAHLERYDVFRGQPRRVEAFSGDTIQEYVRQGYGLGLVTLWSSWRRLWGLWQRPMGRWFGRVSVYAITRKRPKREGLVRAFIDCFRRCYDS
ncbi:MAG TPA: LysR family transcriptional regulator [Planctomycetota bacterium]|nr:LysR family transcriptional regulator [Planctomycetota bacterium]